ncbi:MAG: guanine deaminase [Congregibacter sp.]
MSSELHLGAVLHLLDDPGRIGTDAVRFYRDGALLVENGYVVDAGEAGAMRERASMQTAVIDHQHALLCPGFIDTHVHYPQIDLIGSHGEQLLEWLERYVFPTEARFVDEAHAGETANRFLDELLRNGSTTALVFGTVHRQSAEAFFRAARDRNMRMIAGKVWMDQNAPAELCDTAQTAYDDSKDLIARWHNKHRLRYAVTPRFAPTSSVDQLNAAGALLRECPDVYLHTHMSENSNEVAWVGEIHPDSDHYLHCYDQAGLLGRRSVFAHCIHLSEAEWSRMGETRSNIAFCPTSNLFLGSGLFALDKAEHHQIEVGLGTDIGAGTSFSLLQTMNEAYKVQQLQGRSLAPLKNFYLATLGGARALDLEAELGNFEAGKEADFLVLDLQATPLLSERLKHCEDLSELLFVLMMLGDDRLVRETWVMGELAHVREDGSLKQAMNATPGTH